MQVRAGTGVAGGNALTMPGAPPTVTRCPATTGSMIIRPSTGADLGRLLACRAADPVGLVPPERYRTDLANRNYRPEWTWIAEQDGAIVARAIWWGPAASRYPQVLDCLHVSDSVPHWAGLAADLLQAGHREFRDAGAPDPPRYELRLPNAWRASADVSQAVRWRRKAAAGAGLTQELERLRFEWTPAAGLPRSAGRLMFRPEPDDEAFVAVFRQVAMGSLDVITRREVAAQGADRQAREDFAQYRDMPGDRDWWRLAYTAGGQLAGMILPNRNPYGAIVGYLGVLPNMRGHGYIDDLVAETTRFHAGRGEPRISATTDITNQPMAAAFRRAGYQETGIRYVFLAPAG